MKRLALSICTLVVMESVTWAGSETYSKNQSMVPPAPCPQWYADNEINLSLSGAYAMTGTPWREDTYLGVDHSWDGAFDAKYFMHRYFGVGVQGNVFSVRGTEVIDDGVTRVRSQGDERHAVASILATVTFRYPIRCSRFAPYAWLGGGVIFGGGRSHDFLLDSTAPLGFVRREFDESSTKSVGQVGAGLEIRLTPHIGLLNDFSWNIVSGARNNFGMARTGLNIAF